LTILLLLTMVVAAVVRIMSTKTSPRLNGWQWW
jgi:uncharacterized membrane protein HdeD (DUF308 family)